MSRVLHLKNCLKDLRYDSVKNFWLFSGCCFVSEASRIKSGMTKRKISIFLISLLNMILQKKLFVMNSK